MKYRFALLALILLAACARNDGPAPIENRMLGQNQRPQKQVYTVKQGETFDDIARKFNTTPEEIASTNNLSSNDRLHVGQSIEIPSMQTISGGQESFDAPFVPTPTNGVVKVQTLDAPASTVAHQVAEPAISSTPEPDSFVMQEQSAQQIPTPQNIDSTVSEPVIDEPVIKAPQKATATPKPQKMNAPTKTVKNVSQKTVDPEKNINKDTHRYSLIDDSEAPKEAKVAPKEDTSLQKNTPSDDTSIQTTSAKFLWPVTGKILSPYGPKSSGGKNDGINIAASLGDEVQATDSGTVVYVGNEAKGFGNIVLLKHKNGWMSAYAHCQDILKKKGDKVAKGEAIATVGKTGNVTQTQLHFELRKNKKTVDPTRYLS